MLTEINNIEKKSIIEGVKVTEFNYFKYKPSLFNIDVEGFEMEFLRGW